jgi:predicted ATPase
MQQKIVLIGGPGTGKTSVLNELIKRNFFCLPEVSREVIKKAQKKGIDQLFLQNPLLFSEMLLEGREQQFIEASNNKSKVVFFDRGIPDVVAYLNYFKTPYPKIFTKKSNQYKYNKVFYFAPWKFIYTTDNERYESFKQAQKIDTFVKETYTSLQYTLIKVPFISVEKRTDFIINSIL